MKLLKHSEKGKSKVKRYKWVSLIALAIFAVTASSTVTAESSQKRIILKVDETGMFVDDAEYSTLIDPEAYATPVMVNNRVLLPIGNIIKEFGGSTSWDAAPKKLTLSLNSNKIVLYLNNKKAFVNGAQTNLDVAPTTISGRTMVPLKFVSDHLGLQLIWDQKIRLLPCTKASLAKFLQITASILFLLIQGQVTQIPKMRPTQHLLQLLIKITINPFPKTILSLKKEIV